MDLSWTRIWLPLRGGVFRGNFFCFFDRNGCSCRCWYLDMLWMNFEYNDNLGQFWHVSTWLNDNFSLLSCKVTIYQHQQEPPFLSKKSKKFPPLFWISFGENVALNLKSTPYVCFLCSTYTHTHSHRGASMFSRPRMPRVEILLIECLEAGEG